jgi:DNA-directed RNA polymerase beta subunit
MSNHNQSIVDAIPIEPAAPAPVPLVGPEPLTNNDGKITAADRKVSQYELYKVPDYLKGAPETHVPPLNQDDLPELLADEIYNRGMFSDHIMSGNDFVRNGIKQIMTKTFVIEKTYNHERDKEPEDKKIDTVHISVVPSNITMRPPITTDYATSMEELLTPKTALLEDKTYASALYADMEVTATAHLKDGGTIERKANITQLQLAIVPIMVKCELCNLYNKSYESLVRMEEDPSDAGGHFIIKGIEWVVNNIESSVYNKYKIFRNRGHANEVLRAEMISKPGDSYENSSQLFVKVLTNDQLICVISRAPLDDLQIPFFLLFRLLGWSSDKRIVEWIIHQKEGNVSEFISQKLNAAYQATYAGFTDPVRLHTTTDILRNLVNKIPQYEKLDMSDESTVQFIHTRVLHLIDMYLLPHIGQNPKFRNEKAKYITHIIRDMFLVEMGIATETDRDNLANKRAHSAGVSFAKAFKQQYNFAIVMSIKKHFSKDLKSTLFSKLDLIQTLTSSINSLDFEKKLSQAITTGNKSTIKLKMGQTIVNHLTSQQLHRKNQLNQISTMRQINNSNASASSSKQSARANEMRRSHPSYTGFIDPVQTQDGENVGLNKQQTITCHISPGSSSTALKNRLLKDPDLIPLKELNPEILATGVAAVKVNGHWIGSTATSYHFINRYRQYRREGLIHPETTIFWNPVKDQVMFWVDLGRLIRPVLIVYNNIGNSYTKQFVESFVATDAKANAKDSKTKDVKGAKAHADPDDFKQWIALTNDLLTMLKDGKINIETLAEMNIVEYINPGEQENLLIAPDFDTLWAHRNNTLMRYSHCDIPINMFGFPTLVDPYGAHNPTSRAVLSTQQVKQACGWFSLGWPYRIDKEAFLQYHCEVPLVQTFANKFIRPNGQNIVMAVQIYAGFNQEDSVMINESSVQRGMFDGIHFTFIKSELEKNDDHFGNPDIDLTADIKPYASYEKIFDGFPKKGTLIQKNDVVIGKYSRYTKSEGDYKYVDRSEVYKHEEPAYVFNVVVSRNQDGKPFAKVQLAVVREVQVGDKFSQRTGQKGVCGYLMKEADMPFTADGITPDLIFNPHSLPSRMTINTIYEVITAKLSAAKCETTDGTFFRKSNIEVIRKELRELGMNEYGKEQLYNGMTGKKIDYQIFIGPMFYQRLQKFVAESIRAVSHGSTDALTRQPLSGKASNGGSRIGEMGKDILTANGLARFLSEKFVDHSDGFIVYICRGCGGFSIVNRKYSIYKCKTCGDNADIAEVDTKFAAKLFIQELRTMNIGFRPRLKPFTYHR